MPRREHAHLRGPYHKDLLKGWARSHDLVFIPEYEITTLTKERRYVDAVAGLWALNNAGNRRAAPMLARLKSPPTWPSIAGSAATLRKELDFPFDLNWNVEWQLGHTDGASRVRAPRGTVELENQIREAVDDAWLHIETWR